MVYNVYPATAEQMRELIDEVKKLSSSLPSPAPSSSGTTSNEGTTTNALNVQIHSHYFSNKFGGENNGEALKVYVERYGTTFNVYWKQLEDAAEYSVEVYKYVRNNWYKLTEIFVDRNNGYVAITDLVGVGYVFRVVARNRGGDELARSAGIVSGKKAAE